MFTKSKPDCRTESQIAQATELLATLRGQESSARSAIQDASNHLSEIEAQIANAHAQLAELQQQQEAERAEAEISDTTRQIRSLAEKFNQHAIELIRLYRRMEALDPQGKILFRSGFEKAADLPSCIMGIGSPQVRLMPASELHSWGGDRSRGFDKGIPQIFEKELYR